MLNDTFIILQSPPILNSVVQTVQMIKDCLSYNG
jgi:hypothetical protein